MQIMWRRPLLVGLLLWIAGTAGIRLSGHRLLQSQHISQTLILYLVSFIAMGLLIPRICRRLGLEKDSRLKGATLLVLPTLILDPFSCAFFAIVFPNLEPGAAGVFGGWILICCAGAVAGVWVKP